jgi:hypothetical protein
LKVRRLTLMPLNWPELVGAGVAEPAALGAVDAAGAEALVDAAGADALAGAAVVGAAVAGAGVTGAGVIGAGVTGGAVAGAGVADEEQALPISASPIRQAAPRMNWCLTIRLSSSPTGHDADPHGGSARVGGPAPSGPRHLRQELHGGSSHLLDGARYAEQYLEGCQEPRKRGVAPRIR